MFLLTEPTNDQGYPNSKGKMQSTTNIRSFFQKRLVFFSLWAISLAYSEVIYKIVVLQNYFQLKKKNLRKIS